MINSDKPNLSIFLGGIRPFLWERLYKSILSSVGKYTFELVICGPHSPPESLEQIVNFKYIRDFGNVARGAQLAALLSSGKVITLGADDAVYHPNTLEQALDLYNSLTNLKKVIALRYNEGGNRMPNSYFDMRSWPHFRLPGVPEGTPMMLNCMIAQDYFLEIGGYDCSVFNTCNWGGQDLTCRLKKDGAHIVTHTEPVMSCDHTNVPLDGGMYKDHKPVDIVDDMSSPQSDYHKFVQLYQTNNNRTIISNDTWKLAETVWSKRFAV